MPPKYMVVVECAIEHNGKFLIIKRPMGTHAEGLLSFPGGKFENADGLNSPDALVQAAKREVFEEVGLEILDPLHYVTSSFFTDSKTGENIVDTIFHCKLDKSKVELKISEREVVEYYWLTLDEVQSKENCPEWLVTYLMEVQNSSTTDKVLVHQ